MNVSGYVAGVTVKSAWLPTMRYRPGAKGGKSGGGWLKVLKPEVLIYPKGGGRPFVYAPYGAPGPTQWATAEAVVGVAVMAVLALAVVGAVRIVTGH